MNISLPEHLFFSANGITSSFVDLGTTGTEINADVSGIPTQDNYRWRARIKYELVSNPYQTYGPWRYYEAYQPKSFGSFKSQTSPLPVELVLFNV